MRTAKPKFTIDELLAPESFSAFIHKLGHEIGNPLTSIISLASLLERFGQPDTASNLPAEKLRGYSAAIASEAWRISRMNERLVLICSVRTHSPEPYALSTLIRRVAKQWEKKALFPTISLTLQPPAQEIQVEVDSERLAWVISALIENAALALTEEGEITSKSLNHEIIIAWSMDTAQSVAISVSNRRTSPHPFDLQSLFDPFVSGGSDKRRLGLGLTAAVAVVSRFSGSISITENNIGEAVDFSVSINLPVATTEAKTPSEQRPVSSPAANRWKDEAAKLPRNVSLYIVEDEHTVGTAIQKILTLVLREASGFSAKIVSGADFQSLIAGGGTFDAALCDINLGAISGQMIYETVKSRDPNALRHIAFLTGDRSGKDTQKFLEESGCRYLHKPFEVDELVELVFHLIRGD